MCRCVYVYEHTYMYPHCAAMVVPPRLYTYAAYVILKYRYMQITLKHRYI